MLVFLSALIYVGTSDCPESPVVQNDVRFYADYMKGFLSFQGFRNGVIISWGLAGAGGEHTASLLVE